MRKRKKITDFRFYVVFVFITSIWLFLWGLSYYIQLVKGSDLKKRARSQHWKVKKVIGRRGDILSRNGEILARSIVVKSIFASPRLMSTDEKINTADILSRVLKVKKSYILSRLKSNKFFVWIKRKVDDETAQKVKELSLSGIYLTEETKRIYPQGSMLGQLIGFVNVDNRGLEGLEYKFDNYLSGGERDFLVLKDGLEQTLFAPDQLNTSIKGKDLVLTIDTTIQAIAENGLRESVEKFKALYGMALVVDVKSGEILAWAQYPFFNPNRYRFYSPMIFRNRIAMDEFEPGSTIKPLLVASAMEEGVCSPSSVFFCEEGRWRFFNHIINDTHSYRWLTVRKVIRYSSNICSAKIALKLGREAYYRYLKTLGFGEKTSVAVPCQGKGILRNYRRWNEFDLASIGFGQGISVTLLQLTKAYLCLANKGLLKPLVLIKRPKQPKEKPIRVFSEDTVNKVLSMLKDVVELDGTGRFARVDGIEIGGKTGTAQKSDGYRYTNKYVASFVALIPALNPKYLVAVVIDEPRKAHYGGIVAAPVAGYIAKELTLANARLASNRIVNSFKDEYRYQRYNEWPFNLKVIKTRSTTVVPHVVGLDLKIAIKKLLSYGIIPRIKGKGNFVVAQKRSGKEVIIICGRKSL